MLRKPPELNDEISITATVTSPYTATMGNLGNVTDDGYISSGAGLYHNFFVGPDNLEGTDKSDGKTYYFTFASLVQVSNAAGEPDYNGNYIRAESVRAEASSGTFSDESDSGIMNGMEVAITHYFDARHRLGFVASLNNAGFSTSKSAEWDINMIVSSWLYQGEKLAGRDGFTGYYYRPILFSPGAEEAYIYLGDPTALEDVALGKTTATGSWKLNASFMTLKLGAVYNMPISRRFIVRLSGGLSLVGASSRFRWDETYTAPLDSGDIDVESVGTKTTMKVLLGAWGDIGAHYRVNRKLTVYSSLAGQVAQSYNDTTKFGHRIEIDCSTTYMMKTGFTWAF